MAHDNGDWKSGRYTHYCRIGHCPHNCTSEEDSLQKAQSSMRKSLGMGMTGAELYRWKGVEDANGYYQRGRSQHEILSNALTMQFDKAACDKAIAEVDNAADAELLTYATLNSAKAGLILRDMEKDKNNETSARLTLLTWPVQRFLNATFAADKLACDYMNTQAMDADGAATQQARAKLFKANVEFFNGTRGRKVLSDYVGMITDLNSKAWDGWKGGEETKLPYATKLLVPMVGAWRRLVVPFTDNDAFELLARSGRDGLEIYDADELKFLSKTLGAKMAVCQDCVDQDFTSEMLPLVDSDPELVHKASADNVLMLRVGSGVVERSHIAGQELKPVKSKGVALDAQALAMTTYRKSAIAEGRWLLNRVKGQLLRDRKVCPKAMARHAKSFRFGSGKASRNETSSKMTKKQRLLGGEQRVGLKRKTDGHKKFRRSVWQCKAAVGTHEFTLEERRVSQLWSQMSPGEKALWEAESKAENACLLSVPKDSTMDDVSAAVAKAGNASRGREMALRREAVASTMQAMHSHAAWDNGLGLCSMSSALKPEFVTNDSLAACKALVNDASKHDGTIAQNPEVDTCHRMPCVIRNWGLCSKDPLLQSSNRGTLNIYREFNNNSISRNQFPIITKLSVLGESLCVAITDTVGKGETVLVAFVEFDSDENAKLQHVKVANCTGPQLRCAFSQQVIHQLLHRAAAKNKISPTKVESIDVSYFVGAVPVCLDGGLAFHVGGGQETRSKVPLKSVIPATAGRKEATASDGSGKVKMPFGLSMAAFGAKKQEQMQNEEDAGGSGGADKEDKEKDKMHAGGHAGADGDGDDDLLGPEPEPSDFWDDMPSGSKLGIMGIDIAPGHSAKCWVCVSKALDNKVCKVSKDSIRLWYRHKPGQAEKSMHLQRVTDAFKHATCKSDATDLHIDHSMKFLHRHKHNDSFSDDLKEAMETALANLQALR